MKKYLPIICLLLLAYPRAQAQSKFSGGFFLSPFSSYSGSPLNIESPSRYATGALFGAAFQYSVSSKWSLASGVLYESARVKFNPDGLFSASYIIRRRNVALPLLVNFQPSSKKVSPYLSAGVLFSPSNNEWGVATRMLLAAGLSYRAGSRWLVIAQPAFTLGASSKADRAFFPTNRQLSFQTQLLYRFGAKPNL